VVFTPVTLAPPSEAISRVRFTATPGLRVAPQPARVALNARFALPAGTYRVILTPRASETLSGDWGLQVGRLGTPMTSWAVASAPGDGWSTTFRLDLDANFVGFRGSPELESHLERIDLQPVSIEDASRRYDRGPVLGAATYGGVPVYFHDDRAYFEPGGFWTRGKSSVAVSAALPDDMPSALSLRLRTGGGNPCPVRLATATWSTRVIVGGEEATVVSVPARPGERVLALTISAEGEFVPAEHARDSNDRRVLGCWVEIGR
jgi:hypothetical protein